MIALIVALALVYAVTAGAAFAIVDSLDLTCTSLNCTYYEHRHAVTCRRVYLPVLAALLCPLAMAVTLGLVLGGSIAQKAAGREAVKYAERILRERDSH